MPEITSSSTGRHGRVTFRTTVEHTGVQVSDLPVSAVYQFACYVLISRLNEKSLMEACENLYDLFNWQESASFPDTFSAPAITKRKVAPKRKIVEEAPFVLGN